MLFDRLDTILIKLVDIRYKFFFVNKITVQKNERISTPLNLVHDPITLYKYIE